MHFIGNVAVSHYAYLVVMCRQLGFFFFYKLSMHFMNRDHIVRSEIKQELSVILHFNACRLHSGLISLSHGLM